MGAWVKLPWDHIAAEWQGAGKVGGKLLGCPYLALKDTLPLNVDRPGCAGVCDLTSLLLLCCHPWQRALGGGETPDVHRDLAQQPAVPPFSSTAGVAPERASLGQRGCSAAA